MADKPLFEINVTECLLCGSQDLRSFERALFRQALVEYQVCRNCGMVFQSPRMTAEKLGSYYEREYRLMYQGNEEPTAKDLSVQKGRADSLLSFIHPDLPELKRHLDIGCSAGILLEKVSSLYQNQSVGVEPGTAYRTYAQSRGFKVFPSLQELKGSGEARFDLISLAHVLEHLPDPVGYLASLREDHLEQGGWLLLEVPNLYAHDSFETAHLSAFSAHTLKESVQKAGFEVFALQRHGRPRSLVIPLYITLLARAASPEGAASRPVKPERFVRLKRQFGFLYRRIVTRLFPHKAWLPTS